MMPSDIATYDGLMAHRMLLHQDDTCPYTRISFASLITNCKSSLTYFPPLHDCFKSQIWFKLWWNANCFSSTCLLHV